MSPNNWTWGHYHECPPQIFEEYHYLLTEIFHDILIYVYIIFIFIDVDCLFMQVCVYGYYVLTVCALMVKTNSIFEVILAIDFMAFSKRKFYFNVDKGASTSGGLRLD